MEFDSNSLRKIQPFMDCSQQPNRSGHVGLRLSEH